MLVIHHRVQDAAEIRAPFAEIDVMMTADRVVVCRHDHIYEGETVWSQRYVPGMGPTLTEFVIRCPAKLFVELKLGSLHMGAGLKDFEQQVVAQSPGAFAYLSFDYGSLYRVRQNTKAPLLLSVHDHRLPAPVSAIKEVAQAICVPVSQMAFYSHVHDLPMYVYNVKDPAEIGDKSVQGVITDYPELWR